ncbi:MAG TPA: ABC transporter permease, partial [Thermoanaerobaculia bacterium]
MSTEEPRPPRSAGEIREELDEEIAFHLERRVEDLVRRGVPEAAAREEAARQFGSLVDTREICLKSDLRLERQRRRTAVTRGLWRDLRFAARLFRRQPGFALLAAGTIALGVAAATTVFSAVDHVLLRPLPYAESDRVVVLQERDLRSGADTGVSVGNLLSWSGRTGSFAAMGMAEPNGVDLTSVEPPEPIQAWGITPGFLEALGAEPLLGRAFLESDFRPGMSDVVLISHRLWTQRFGSDPAILGKDIALDGSPARVVGVLRPALPYPDTKGLWFPRPFTADDAEDRNGNYREGIARLRPGVTQEAAQADLDRVAGLLAAENPRTNQGKSVRAIPIREHVLGTVRPGLTVLFGAA